jgi:Transposase DDE domain
MTQPLVLVLLLITWCCGDSQAERFESARAATATCLAKRRRPGRTVQGFQKALARLPLAVLRSVAAGVRQRIAERIAMRDENWVVMGCDGSMVSTPRTAELEQRLGRRGKKQSAPGVWVTALVHLRTGVLWAWRLGRSTASERIHLKHLLTTLPSGTLLVADAGFNGYGLAQAIRQAGASFLIRMSGKDFLYTDTSVSRRLWKDGIVYCWPQTARANEQPPLPLRLICVRGWRRKHVWLLTDVLDPRRLSTAMAVRYYRWRWENEGFFRTYKRTLAKMKLLSRTVPLVHREAEGALLATQMLLASGTQALTPSPGKEVPVRCSPRQVLRELRRELLATTHWQRRISLSRRLALAIREQRPRVSQKVARRWPRRRDHQQPKPPRFLALSDQLKALRDRLEKRSA